MGNRGGIRGAVCGVTADSFPHYAARPNTVAAGGFAWSHQAMCWRLRGRS